MVEAGMPVGAQAEMMGVGSEDTDKQMGLKGARAGGQTRGPE